MKKYKIYVLCIILFMGFAGFLTFAGAAEIVYMEGNVQVQSSSDKQWKGAEKGMKLDIGDSVRTARRSFADIALDSEKKNLIRIDPKTLVVLNSASPDTIDRIDLSRGKIYSNLENIKAGLSFEVNTPSAVAGVRGSSYSVYAERDEDEVQAYKDTVFIKTFDADKKELSEVMLPEGFKTFIERFETPSALIQVTTRDLERFDNIMEDLSARAEGRESARAEREAAMRRERQERQKEAEKSTLEKKSEQATEQEGIISEVSDTKALIEERNTEQEIEDFRNIISGGGHEH